MPSGPSRIAEALVAFFTPPACREEVLGDLHERYSSSAQYGWEALCTVPMVIASRIRRTADAQVLTMQAFALCLSFLGAAWFADRALIRQQWGLLRLAIPAAMALAGIVFEDAYASPGRRSPLKLVRGPVVGLGLALFSQAVFWSGHPDLAVPRWIAFNGCALSLLLSSAIRLSFPPPGDQLQGASAPAYWLKRGKESGGRKQKSEGGRLGAVKVAIVCAVLMLAASFLWWGATHRY
jgi:hypothetical protein